MPVKAKLIFNPAAGNPAESAVQLVELLRHLQTQQIQVEVVLVQSEHRLHAVARSAARAGRAGAKMVIVSGGDGTIENVALGLVGSQTTLGIIPTGTRNRVASRAASAFPPTHAISPTPSCSCVKDAGSKLTWGRCAIAKRAAVSWKPAPDGIFLGESSVTVMLHPHRLRVMAGPAGVAAATPTPAAVAEATV